MTELWPRLGLAPATVAYRALEGEPAQLAVAARTKHPQMTYAATGGRRIGETGVRQLAEAVRANAEDFGYPYEVDTADLVRFDRVAAETVHKTMNITAVEAGTRGVWSFLSVVAMPDITQWRFPNRNVERWIATDLTRHMFARLWWQATTFVVVTEAGHDYSLLRSLSESDLNQITERRSIAGVTPLARSIARVALDLGSTDSRRAVFREAVPRLRRLMAFVDFATLSDDQLDDRVRSVFGAAASAVRGPS